MNVCCHLGGIFDFDLKQERLEEVIRELEDPDVWSNQEKAQTLGKEKVSLDELISTVEIVDQGLLDSQELLQMAFDEKDFDYQ